jgi:hypothetical protein
MVLYALIWVWKECYSVCYNLIKEKAIINAKNGIKSRLASLDMQDMWYYNKNVTKKLNKLENY